MKKMKLLIFVFLLVTSHLTFGQLRSFTYEACSVSSSGSPSYFPINKTFTGVPLATYDVSINISMLGCNPYEESSGGFRLAGTTYSQLDVKVGNCFYRSNNYVIPMAIFNQAVIAGNGTIKFEFYLRDRCVPGMGCSGYNDPCISMSVIVNTSCRPTTSTQNITSCGPFTWIDGLTYTENNNTATHVLTNVAGCDSTVTLNLTIGDFTSPVPDVAILPTLTSECAITSLISPTATDACSGSIVGTHNATLPITINNTIITWSYTDGSGNVSTQTQIVSINDNLAPVPDLPQLPDITASCSITSLTAPTATDNCSGTITGVHNATLPILTQGTTQIVWSFTDGKGNVSTQNQQVILHNVTPPTPIFASLPAISSQCAITSLIAPIAKDNCSDFFITGTHNAILPITSQGTTVVTWTYLDGNGNTTTQNQDIIISDYTAPVPDAASLPTLNETCQITQLTAPTATDNCAGTITGTHNVTLPITQNGTFVITWTFNDGNGNIATQNQTVTLNDDLAPVPDVAALAPVTSQCLINNIVPPTATDNCSGSIIGTPNVSFPITQQGSFVITWTFSDGNGNSTTQTQNVTLNDNIAPVPNNAILAPIVSNCIITQLTAPTATDNCAGTLTATHNATLPLTTAGTTTISWTYTDENGNTSSQNQTITLQNIVDNSIFRVNETTLKANAMGSNITYQWVDCGNNNTPISGATSQSFSPLTSGSFACEINNGTCTTLSACLSNGLATQETTMEKWIIYPNPTTGDVTISLGQMENQVKTILFNTLGQIIETQEIGTTETVQLHLKGDKGMYLLQIQTEREIVNIHLIKH